MWCIVVNGGKQTPQFLTLRFTTAPPAHSLTHAIVCEGTPHLCRGGVQSWRRYVAHTLFLSTTPQRCPSSISCTRPNRPPTWEDVPLDMQTGARVRTSPVRPSLHRFPALFQNRTEWGTQTQGDTGPNGHACENLPGTPFSSPLPSLVQYRTDSGTRMRGDAGPCATTTMQPQLHRATM